MTTVSLSAQDADIARLALINLRNIIKSRPGETATREAARAMDIPYGPDIYARISREIRMQLIDLNYMPGPEPL